MYATTAPLIVIIHVDQCYPTVDSYVASRYDNDTAIPHSQLLLGLVTCLLSLFIGRRKPTSDGKFKAQCLKP